MSRKIFIKSGLGLIVGALWYLPHVTQAALTSVNLYLNLTVVENTCRVAVGSQDQVVQLGTWASKQFSENPSKASTVVPFVIQLQECGEAASLVAVTFKGVADTKNNALLALTNTAGTAKNVGIAILDNKKAIIPLGRPSPKYAVSAKQPQINLQFYAQYLSTALPVTPGQANADATFELTYD